MAESFDPYHKWLGIPPEDQPPNHYRLLGIKPFESDPDVIESAADQRMAHLRTYQSGKHSKLSQKLLNNVAGTKVCLLKPEKKATYDEALRGKLRAEAKANLEALPTARPLVADAEPASARIPAPRIDTSGPVHRRRPRKTAWQIPVLAVSLVVAAVLVYALWPRRSAALVFSWPENQPPDALLIDGKTREVPPEGPARFACEDGSYDIIARREGCQTVELTVTVRAGEKRNVVIVWLPEPEEGWLLVQWPKNQPPDALLIDGERRELPPSGSEQLFRCPVGEHHVTATRTESEHLELTVTVRAGEKRSVPLIWESKKGTLVVIWREEQRADGTLLIDGQLQEVPATGPLEYRLQPGEYSVSVRWPSSEPFEETATLAVDQRTLVKVVKPNDKEIEPPGGDTIVVQSAVNRANRHVYHLIKAKDGVSGVSWTQAESAAKALGGHLATINDAAENAWITSTFSEYYYLWIGLNDVASEGNFVWASGEPVNYTNWWPGEPNDFEGGQDYVYIYNFDQGNRQWDDNSNIASSHERPMVGVAEVPQPVNEIILGLGDGVKMKLVLISAGEFKMGSPDDEGDDDEHPQHLVRITRPFYLGKYEVTQAQYQQVMGANPSEFQGDPRRPVERVSWDDATKFCRRLTEQQEELTKEEGRIYRLPTEAEWEYACRAGTTTRFSFGDHEKLLRDYAWYSGKSGGRTHTVGQKKPNAWGLYDMHGNVREWCADWNDSHYYANSPTEDPTGPVSASLRVARGSGYIGSCRTADRAAFSPDNRAHVIGFRVACSAPSELPDATNLIRVLSSEMIASLVAIGRIANISGRSITLIPHGNVKGGLAVPIEVRENAKLASITFPSKEGKKNTHGTPIKEDIEFRDLKLGDYVNIAFRIMPDCSLQGLSVIVFPSQQERGSEPPPPVKPVRLQDATNLIKVLSSEMIPSLVAIGKIANISRRTITLKAHAKGKGGLTIPIEIGENSQLASFTFPSKEGEKDTSVTPIREEIEFKDIKVGDKVNINFRIMPDGAFEGLSVIVFPRVPT